MNSHKDEEQLEFATSLGRAVYTRNAKDFHRLHRDYQAACRLPVAVPDFLAIVFLALGACRCCKKPLEFSFARMLLGSFLRAPVPRRESRHHLSYFTGTLPAPRWRCLYGSLV